jgi:hypothetical protein
VRDGNGKVIQFGGLEVIDNGQTIMEQWGVVMGLYAGGGKGKTTFACSLADPAINPEGHDLPMAILDAEAGIKSVAHLIGPNLQEIPCNTVTKLEAFVAAAKVTPRADFPWKTLALDNLSFLVTQALEEQGLHGRSTPGGGLTSSQPDYNAMTTRLTSVLRDLRDLSTSHGANIIFFLWEQTEKTEAGVVLGHRADITPRLGSRVQGMLDYIGYMTVLNNPPRWTRKLDFSPNPELDSKMRRRPDEASQAIPFELYNPNLADILNTIKRGAAFPVSKFARPVSAVTGR